MNPEIKITLTGVSFYGDESHLLPLTAGFMGALMKVYGPDKTATLVAEAIYIATHEDAKYKIIPQESLEQMKTKFDEEQS